MQKPADETKNLRLPHSQGLGSGHILGLQGLVGSTINYKKYLLQICFYCQFIIGI